MITIEINSWNSHLNHLLYALFFYCKKNKVKFLIKENSAISTVCLKVNFKGKILFFDYSDDFKFEANPKEFDYYFKRSITFENISERILPLNFQINFAYQPLSLLLKMPLSIRFIKKSKVEIIRALDFFGITNMSHFSMLLHTFRLKKNSNGRIIFCTRLWNPNNAIDDAEKQRREKQNLFRIEACRIIKKNFNNSFVGVFDSDLARILCPDLIFKEKVLSKKRYLNELRKSDICVVDDGLKDSIGWKFGEYVLFGKAIISTPTTVYIESFFKNKNYLELSNRLAYSELIDSIQVLLNDNFYLEMGKNNSEWASNYLEPEAFISNILKVIK